MVNLDFSKRVSSLNGAFLSTTNRDPAYACPNSLGIRVRQRLMVVPEEDHLVADTEDFLREIVSDSIESFRGKVGKVHKWEHVHLHEYLTDLLLQLLLLLWTKLECINY